MNQYDNIDYKRSYSNRIISEEKKYSLLPDMISGWKPSISHHKIINLDFKSPFDQYFKNLIKNKDPSVVYVGPRPFDSYIIQKILNKQNQKQLNQGNNLQFDSNFQSGNIDFVQSIQPREYLLWMRCDSNAQHTQWFYFKVKNTKQFEQVNFTIYNFYKKKSIYQSGMKPYVKSKKSGQGWVQEGEQIKYFEDQKLQNKQFFSLSFKYRFLHDNDEVSFAYCIPYTYSKLNKYLEKVIKQNNDIIAQQNLCNTSGNIQCPLLTITNKQSNLEKQTILISARIHPGESNSSFVMEGLINYLLSEQARILRDFIVFKIIPMLNPDGVVLGNYRCGIMGCDYNREFKQNQNNFPTIQALMNLAQNLKKKENLIMYIDLHGHSIKRNSFAYGPRFDQNQSEYYECRLFPKLISKFTEMFKYCQCRFKQIKEKSQTSRIFIQNLCELTNCFTIESSFGCYISKQGQQELFDKQGFINIGESIGKALDQFIKSKNQEKIFCTISTIQKKNSLQIKNSQQIQDKIYKKHKSTIQDQKQPQIDNKFKYYKNLVESLKIQDKEYENQSESHDEHSDFEQDQIEIEQIIQKEDKTQQYYSLDSKIKQKNKQESLQNIKQKESFYNIKNNKNQESFITQNKNNINTFKLKYKKQQLMSNGRISVFPTQCIGYENLNQQEQLLEMLLKPKKLAQQKSQNCVIKKIVSFDTQLKMRKTQSQQKFFEDNNLIIKKQIGHEEKYNLLYYSETKNIL